MTETARQEPGEDQERSFWASFTRADIRLLVVTFAGTLAANVMTVLVVAAAIIVFRAPDPSQTIPVGGLLFVTGSLGLGIAVVVGVSLDIRRRRRQAGTAGRLLIGLMVVSILEMLVFLLVLVGWAVGVK